MPQYRYTAYDLKGKKCRGKKEFSSELEFRKFLKSKRMILIQFDILKKTKNKTIMDLKTKALKLEVKRIKKIHEVLNEKQKEEFADYLEEWEIE